MSHVGARVAVEQTGRGEPLVLLHGIATDSRIWSTVVPELSRCRRVVCVDLPGFGRSEPVGDDFVLADVAEAVGDRLAECGVETPYDLVGHSLGGAVAIQFAAQFSAALRSLTLVAPAGLRPLPAAIAGVIASGRAARLLAGSTDGFFAARRRFAGLTDLAWGRRLLLGLAVADGAQVPPAVARSMIEASEAATRTGPALATIVTTDLRPLLRHITAPVGVIWGEADRTVPITGLEDLLGERPDAEVIRLPGTGHLPMVERPADFVAALWQLIERASADPHQCTPFIR
jgi:pimeloyl-ACP methyl ester carboxylesterase